MSKSEHRQKRRSPRSSSGMTRGSIETDLSHIVEPLRSFAVPTNSLNLDQENPNLHGDDQIEQIIESMRELGQDELLIFRPDGRIVTSGNGRLVAARRLVERGDRRWENIAAIAIDEDHEQALIRGLAHNALPRQSTFDRDVLAKITKTIIDAKRNVKATGLDPDEVTRLLERLKAKTPTTRPASTRRQVRFMLPAKDYERLMDHLLTFAEDRDAAFLAWLQQSLKGMNR